VRVELIALLGEAGFDLIHPFDAHACARELDLPMLADAERPVGWLVGNTRAMWPRFLAARRADAALSASPDPINDYTEQTCAKLDDARCLFAHRKYGETWVPFQRLAVAAGLGTLSSSNLVIHSTFGPWFALRAVVLTKGTPTRRVLPTVSCECGTRCRTAFDRAQNVQSNWRDWLAVRDACTVGKQHRYSDEQIEYHYTKSLELLR
jgi:methylmalonic aciduria homocystinuria type C protein